MGWDDEEIRRLFDDWIEEAADKGEVDDRLYRPLLIAFLAGFRHALDAERI